MPRILLYAALALSLIGCPTEEVDPCYADVDGDGVSSCDGDCDDTTVRINPNNPEACDGIDNDCDGELGIGDGEDADEGDPDNDGYLNCEDCDSNNGAIPARYPCP